MKYTTLAILALAANYVSAYCPNLCSGHGTCGVKDTCDCYNYIGTQRGDHTNTGQSYSTNLKAAWTGPDCSLRTCPVAYSWSGATPNGLSAGYIVDGGVGASGVYTLVIDTTAHTDQDTVDADLSFQKGAKIAIGTQGLRTIRSAAYSASQITITTIEELPAAVADDSTVYVAPQENDLDLDAKDSNGAHGMLECAGQGVCDRTSGNCDCFPGYEGEACTRSVCPNDCSGNGICLSAERLSNDAGQTYTLAWDTDKHFGCKCDLGFRGPDCSLQECPSDYDPLHGCGGGVCNEGGNDDGSGAAACPNKDLSDCNSKEQRDCSGRGICDYETGMCKCFSGFFGEACEKQTILI